MATDSPLLTDGQRKLAGFAIALFALLASVALLVSVVWALAWLVGRFGGVLWPLATAGIVALTIRTVASVVITVYTARNYHSLGHRLAPSTARRTWTSKKPRQHQESAARETDSNP